VLFGKGWTWLATIKFVGVGKSTLNTKKMKQKKEEDDGTIIVFP